MCTSNYAGSACTRNGATSGAYGNGESCSISFGSAKPLSVYTFNTETNYDKLYVNGGVTWALTTPRRTDSLLDAMAYGRFGDTNRLEDMCPLDSCCGKDRLLLSQFESHTQS